MNTHTKLNDPELAEFDFYPPEAARVCGGGLRGRHGVSAQMTARQLRRARAKIQRQRKAKGGKR